MPAIEAVALDGLPEIRPGDDLGALIFAACPRLADDDVVAVAHKVVSKVEGRVRALASIEPGARALELAPSLAKDPRQVQAVLDESADLLRAERGVLISPTRPGFVRANAAAHAPHAPPH